MTTTTSANHDTPTPTSGRKTWLWIVGGLLGGLLLGWLTIGLINGRLPFTRPEFHGMVMQSPKPVTNFTLTSGDGQEVSLRDFRDKVVLLYFGYTYCPDVCPATMVELATAMNSLGKQGQDVQIIMISVDPLRDTPEVVDAYVKQFHPSFVGLTGTDDEIASVAIPLGIYYEAHEGTPASGYLIDHTATVAVIDKAGYLRLIYPFDTAGEDIAQDMRYLIRD